MFAPEIRILVVDDMKTMRKIVMKSLKTLGFSDFIEAEDGAKAWEQLNNSESKVGLIVSDWNMPNCTGLDFLKRVRANATYKETPFVLLTAESELDQVREAVASGVDNYIVKPFSADILGKKLEVAHKKRFA
ncbi:MAG: response regulator [Bdellovibrionaceae bacterium]|jgi:two-component system, chemotaxis family, chemotaxis protein CheY|nr:response regulator [Pseudobdellovibrionaceae bacterium]